jgi:hypothetical protein
MEILASTLILSGLILIAQIVEFTVSRIRDMGEWRRSRETHGQAGGRMNAPDYAPAPAAAGARL